MDLFVLLISVVFGVKSSPVKPSAVKSRPVASDAFLRHDARGCNHGRFLQADPGRDIGPSISSSRLIVWLQTSRVCERILSCLDGLWLWEGAGSQGWQWL